MVTRRERVVLDVESNAASVFMRDAAAAKALANTLDGVSRTSLQTSRATAAMSRDVDKVATATTKADRSINQLTGRLRLFADLAAILGPGLAPIAAVGVPALAGLANQMGAAALAGGVMVTAFQGVGDGLKAMNKAALEPTAANLEAARVAMEELSPAAQQMVLRMQELKPVLTGIRDAAAEGMFPGMLESIDNLVTRADDVERIFERIGVATGNALSEGTESLASGRWDEFFAFLADEVPSTVTTLGRTVGALSKGMAELWMAFDPLNDDFSAWLLDVARGFDQWASGLDQTQGFQGFVDYVRTNGPQVADTFVALADAILEIGEAAAPLGGPVLKGLEAVAKTVAAIADSPLGTPIMGAVGAMALLNRAQSTYAGLAATTWGAKAKADVTGMKDNIGALGTTMYRLGQSTADADAKTKAARATVGQYAGTFGKAAGVAGALAVATSGVAEKVGLANTASLGLMGTLGGPLGVAAGAAIGFTMDVAAANDQAADSLDRFRASLEDAPGAFREQSSMLQQATRDVEAFMSAADGDSAGESLRNIFTSLAPWQNGIEEIFGTSEIDEQKQALADLRAQYESNVGAVGRLEQAFDNGAPQIYTQDMNVLEATFRRAKPAMDALGISLDDISNASGAELDGYVTAIGRFNREADSIPGRTRSVADAISDLDNDLISTAESAGQLASALNALFSPQLNLSEATDQFQGALRALDGNLAKGSRSLKGFGSAALQNREQIRGLATNLNQLLVAQAEAGAGPRKLAATLARGRSQIMQFGRAAGIGEKDLRGFLRQIGLTPRMVRTVLRAQGMDKAAMEARQLRRDFERLPRNIRMWIRTNGVPKTKADLRALENETGKLTKREKRILMTLRAEAARQGISNVNKLLANLDKKKAEPKADLNNSAFVKARESVSSNLLALNKRKAVPSADLNKAPFDSGIRSANAALTAFGNRSETATVTTIRVTETRNADGGVHDFYADGGVRPRWPRIGDQQPQVRPFSGPAGITWSEEGSGPWEGFVSGHPAKRGRSMSVAEEIVSRLGGSVAWRAADGLLLERASRATPASPRVHVTAAAPSGPMEIVGTLDTPWGPAQVRGIARQEAVRVVSSKERQDSLVSGMRR